MRRLARIVLNTLTVLSLVLLIASVELWVRSYSGSPARGLALGRSSFHATAWRGIVSLTWAGTWPDPSAAREGVAASASARPAVVIPKYRLELMEELCKMLREEVSRLRRRSEASHEHEQWLTEVEAHYRSFVPNKAAAIWPGQPVVAEVNPEQQSLAGVTVERGAARFPRRRDDGWIGYGAPVNYVAVELPCWMPTGVFAIAPLAFAARALRRWETAVIRRRRNLCPDCGYDLRATPGRCPECGTVFESAPASR